jgi:hypothetical protein
VEVGLGEQNFQLKTSICRHRMFGKARKAISTENSAGDLAVFPQMSGCQNHTFWKRPARASLRGWSEQSHHQ